MSARVIPFPVADLEGDYRDASRAEHLAAAIALTDGDTLGYLDHLREANRLRELASVERVKEETRRMRLALQLAERRRGVAAVGGLIALVRRDLDAG